MKAHVQNLSKREARQWVAIGLPPSMATDRYLAEARLKGREGTAPAVVDGGLLHVRPGLKGLVTAELDVQRVDGEFEPFSYSDWITDDWRRVVPRWVVTAPDGTRVVVDCAQPRLIDARATRHTWSAGQVLPGGVCLEMWWHLDSDQDSVDFELRLSYGTTDGGGLRGHPGRVSMLVGERPTIDWRARKGLHAPMPRTDVAPGQVWWEAELAAGNEWLRCQTREIQGAFLCMPPESQWHALDKQRVGWLEARREAPVVGILDRRHWEGSWCAFGAVPDLAKEFADGEQQRRWADFLRRYRTPSDALEPRPYAQPPRAGTTGQQADFGASRCEHAVSRSAPWAVYDLRYSAEAWPLRPYANRTPGGAPVQAISHPGARLYNLRPDERFGTDLLGWPRPVGYFEYYGTSDDQHRSDNTLVGTWLLTRSKSLERTIRDIIECQKMDQFLSGAPRAIGRVLMSLCHLRAAGFDGLDERVRQIVDAAWRNADYRQRPESFPVRVYSSREGKYGWNDPSGQPIRAWLPWQETIALMGFVAAHKVFGLGEAREMAEVMASTVVEHGFIDPVGGVGWRTAYGREWHEDGSVGQPFIAESMHKWMLPAAKLLRRWRPADSERAKDILTAYPVRDWDEACWLAV